MFGFITKAAHDATIADKDAEIAGLAYQLVKEEERANRIAGRLSVADKQAAQVPHLEAENHRLTAELARLTTRGPGGRFVKIGALAGTKTKPSNGASALGVVS